MQSLKDFEVDMDSLLGTSSVRDNEGAVRPSVDQTVHFSVDGVQEKEDLLAFSQTARGVDDMGRCAVCTLPAGSCAHTRFWFQDRAAGVQPDSIDAELDDLTEVLSREKVHTAPPTRLSVESIQWSKPTVLLSDKVQGHYIDVSSPSRRGGHTMVQCGNLVVVFGGYSVTDGSIFQPYETILEDAHVECNSDIFVYHLYDFSWHHPAYASGQSVPEARFGHTAVSLGDRHMLIHGGRAGGGRCLADTWILDVVDFEWRQIEYGSNYIPTPRYFAAMTVMDGVVFLFGGTNGVENFADTWIFDLENETWRDVLTIGTPPRARYGHRIVPIGNGRLAVVGGCAVSMVEELGNNPANTNHAMKLAFLSRELSDSYDAEGVANFLSSKILSSQVNTMDWSAMFRLAQQLAGRVAAAERATCAREEHFAFQASKYTALKELVQKRSLHPLPFCDVVILDTQDAAWLDPAFIDTIVTRGNQPPPRMHHTCHVILNKLIVYAGCVPTCTKILPVSEEIYIMDLETFRWSTPFVKNTPACMQPTINWAQSEVKRAQRMVQNESGRGYSMGVPGGRVPSMAEAEAQLEVAKWRLRTLLEEQSNIVDPPGPRFGHSDALIGQRIYIFGGWTDETTLSEFLMIDLEQQDERDRRLREEFFARLERDRRFADIHKRQHDLQEKYENRAALVAEEARLHREWAQMKLEDERSRLPPLTIAPQPQVLTANQHTMWVHWKPVEFDSRNNPVDPGSITYTLSMRGGFRQIEEGTKVWVRNLEHEEIIDDVTWETVHEYNDADSDDDEQSDDEDDGDDNEEGEGKGAMSESDRKKARLQRRITRMLTQHQEKSEKEKAAREGGEQHPDSEAKGSPQRNAHGPRAGTERSVTFGATPNKADGCTAEGSVSSSKHAEFKRTLSTASEGQHRYQVPKWFRATVRRCYWDGTFDVVFSDGGFESKVPRVRIRPRQKNPWQVVYVGKDTNYTIMGLVPDRVLAREPGLRVRCKFILQTHGAEFPVEHPSRHSLVGAGWTLNSNTFAEAPPTSAGPQLGDDTQSLAGSQDGLGADDASDTLLPADQQSKSRRKIVEAQVADQLVRIEQWKEELFASALGSHYT